MGTTEADVLSHKKRMFSQLAIPCMTGHTFIPLDAIYYMKASGNYTDIMYVVSGSMKKETVSKKIGYFEEVLAEKPFLRVHDSYIVNLHKIIKYFKGKDGSIQLSNGDYLPVSRTRKDDLFTVFGVL